MIDLGGSHRRKIDTSSDSIQMVNCYTSLTLNGRGERIRTSDPLVPNQVRYQTALRPEIVAEWMPVEGAFHLAEAAGRPGWIAEPTCIV